MFGTIPIDQNNLVKNKQHAEDNIGNYRQKTGEKEGERQISQITTTHVHNHVTVKIAVCIEQRNY